jgi:GT2 family glycosyltransferase
VKIAACVTTRNRLEFLAACLAAFQGSTAPPDQIVVSDDSSDATMRARTRAVVERVPGATYLEGPLRGVCANRNHALAAVRPDIDLVSFIDDDVVVDRDFFENARTRYAASGLGWDRIILTGVAVRNDGGVSVPVRLSFRGYFVPAATPEAVAIWATVFPHRFLKTHRFDENIFFGYEDAELCLRALKAGYAIQLAPELRTRDTGTARSTLAERTEAGQPTFDRYESLVESARLYVGTKRYLVLFPNPLKAIAFQALYFLHLPIYLARRRALGKLPEIVRAAHLERLLRRTPSDRD